jgi:endonuclease/exonuclease/phosphatase family metal-dependent hydrolase
LDLRILSYNIRFGGRNREKLLVHVLQSTSADLVVLQEASDPMVVESLARNAGFPIWASKRKWSLGFLSRLAGVDWHWHRDKKIRNPILEIGLENPPLNIYGVHLSPRFSKWRDRYRLGEVNLLLNTIIANANSHRPHFLTGDFNTLAPGDRARVEFMPAWIKALIRISGGRIGTEAIATLLRNSYVDAFRRLYPHLPGYTFPTFSPQVRLDYTFLSSNLAKTLKECTVVNAPAPVIKASDHFPLLTVLSL